MRRVVTQEEKDYIRDNWGRLSVIRMGINLDRHPDVIRRQAINMGLTERKAKKYVSESQVRRMVEMYKQGYTDSQIGESMGLTRSTVVAHRLKIGLSRRDTKGMFEGWCDDLTGMRRRMLCEVWK